MSARDLPAHGLRTQLLSSYVERRWIRSGWRPKPHRWPTCRYWTTWTGVVATITELATELPQRQIILVGHSMAGLVLNRVGKSIPELIGRLVYLSAWMVADGRSFNDYLPAPEFATTKVPTILVADPMVVGALRMDFRSGDPAYQAQAKDVFASDVDDADWAAVPHLLTPDTPAGPMGEQVSITAGRWGRIPRTYISCTADQAVPVAAQRRFIDEADVFTPGNRTEVREMAINHSPFMSQPEQLAGILSRL